VREIQGLLYEQYEVEVSPQLISEVTEEVMAEVKEWQSRPLEAVYAAVFIDAIGSARISVYRMSPRLCPAGS
jgi:transposase-like protein